MSIVAIQEVLDKLPVAELKSSLSEFLGPFTGVLPDKRLEEVAQLGVQGIIAAQSPLINQMARTVPRNEASSRAASARLYLSLRA